MPGLIAEAPTTRGMLLTAAREITGLLTIMGGTAPASRILMASGTLGRPATPPLVVIRGLGAGQFSFDCHVDLARKDADYILDVMISQLAWRFTHAEMATPTDTRERPLICEVAPPTGYVVDDGWKTRRRSLPVAVTHRQF